MKSKLSRLALLTSPILALYGIAPVFLLNSIQPDRIAIGFVLLMGMIFVFWRFNIYLSEKVEVPLRRYVISFTVTLLQHALIIMLVPQLFGQKSAISFSIYPMIATLAVNSIILVIIHLVLLQQKKEMAESEIQRLKVSQLEAQKRVLLQQLQPHFLFNALSTLKSLIRESADEAEDYAVRLSEFLRYSIQAHSNELVALSDELQFTLDYVALQKTRFGEAFHCDIHIDDAALGQRLPAFALQTLVENALKHNAFTEKKPLRILIRQEGDRLRISNTKNPKPLKQTSGTGLLNLRERYKLVSDREIEILDRENEFVVCLNLLEP